MRYAVCVPKGTWNDSVDMPCVYGFEAKNDEDALKAFTEELRKKNTIFHRQSRLFSGGCFWDNAVLVRSGEAKPISVGATENWLAKRSL